MKTRANIIAELRREAGYTQKTLADALNITDKAVSKWERGLSLPDVALLPKLSALLDADIELLLQEEDSALHQQWSGLIDLRGFLQDMAQMLYDKPMVYYVLSHFMLMDIREIYVLGAEGRQSWLCWDKLKEMGLQFFADPKELPKKNLMIMQHPCFLFGSDLTRRYQAAMSTGRITKVCPEWNITPFLFCPMEYAFMYFKNSAYLYENAASKTLGRGMVCMPMDRPEQLNDVASFVRMYQSSAGLKLQDIEEIAKRKAGKECLDEEF